MSLVYCENCKDTGVIKVRKHYEAVFRKQWCTCSKGIYLKKESQKDMYE